MPSDTPPAGVPPLPVDEAKIAALQTPAAEQALGGPPIPMRITRPPTSETMQAPPVPAAAPPAPGRKLAATFGAPDADRVLVRTHAAKIREAMAHVISAIEAAEATVPALLDQLDPLAELAKSAEGFDAAEARALLSRLTKALDSASAK
jgi:hypothetical protein